MRAHSETPCRIKILKMTVNLGATKKLNLLENMGKSLQASSESLFSSDTIKTNEHNLASGKHICVCDHEHSPLCIIASYGEPTAEMLPA